MKIGKIKSKIIIKIKITIPMGKEKVLVFLSQSITTMIIRKIPITIKPLNCSLLSCSLSKDNEVPSGIIRPKAGVMKKKLRNNNKNNNFSLLINIYLGF